MALKICSIGSGSKGNAVYITNGSCSFLIDCGLSVSDIKSGLARINTSLKEIDGILITHEHIDHIRSVGMLAEGYGIPMYAHENTFKALRKKFPHKIKNAATYKTFAGFSLCGLHIIPFQNSHDVFTVGYSIADGDSRIVYATDLGYVTPTLMELSQNADLVMLESNYDPEMLRNGRYPYYLKRRIASEAGHLSNNDCAAALAKMLERGTKRFILGHLSEENNIPSLALATSGSCLQAAGATEGKDYYIGVALQRRAGALTDTTLSPEALSLSIKESGGQGAFASDEGIAAKQCFIFDDFDENSLAKEI